MNLDGANTAHLKCKINIFKIKTIHFRLWWMFAVAATSVRTVVETY